jgi:hypothetical protein
MMLSASAARMGCVRNTLRHIGKRNYRSVARGSSVDKARNSLSHDFRVPLASDVCRWKSTMATYSDSEDEDESVRSHGHAEAAKARSVFS